MDYRKMQDTYYVRADKGDEIIATLLDVCAREGIESAIFTGIGGCSSAELQTFLPETGSFETERLEGMLELISITGNITASEGGAPGYHAHALYSFKQDGVPRLAAGHLKSSVVRFTAEIELRPVRGGVIRKQYDPETGTGFWNLRG